MGVVAQTDKHPRDRFITVLGRKPVLVALEDSTLMINKVVLVHGCRTDIAKRILDAAARRQVPVDRANEAHITKLARNATQHQGVIADVEAPNMDQLANWLGEHNIANSVLLVLSQVSNPANVGMIIRSAEAAGITGVVLPRAGSPDIDPTVVKASAGVAFFSTILRCPTDIEAITLLGKSGFSLIGLDGNSNDSIYEPMPSGPLALVVGNETEGLGESIKAHLDYLRVIPMQGRAESLNVANAASVAIFEVMRQRLHTASIR